METKRHHNGNAKATRKKRGGENYHHPVPISKYDETNIRPKYELVPIKVERHNAFNDHFVGKFPWEIVDDILNGYLKKNLEFSWSEQQKLKRIKEDIRACKKKLHDLKKRKATKKDRIKKKWLQNLRDRLILKKNKIKSPKIKKRKSWSIAMGSSYNEKIPKEKWAEKFCHIFCGSKYNCSGGVQICPTCLLPQKQPKNMVYN